MADLLGSSTTFLRSVQRFIFSKLIYLLVVYMLSFLVFAVIRVFTGISIKRLGYFSLRDVTFSPKRGMLISIKRLGLSFHRPNVARPGWISFVISGLHVSVDPEVTFSPDLESNLSSAFFGEDASNSNSKASRTSDRQDPKDAETPQNRSKEDSKDPAETHGWSVIPPKTRLFYIVRFILRYSKCLDVTFANTSYTCQGITTVTLGILQFRLDLRTGLNKIHDSFVGTLDTRIESGIRAHSNIMLQDLYFGTPLINMKSEQIIQSVSLNIDGILDEEDLSVTDLAFTFRLGKTSIRVDQILNVLHSIRSVRRKIMQSSLDSSMASSTSSSSPNKPLKRAQTVHVGLFTEQDRQNFSKAGTLLIRVVKKIDVKSESLALLGIPMSISDALESVENYDSYMKTCNRFAFNVEDFSLDLRRLNPENPGFKLNFSEEDSAHQGILSLSSLSVGIESTDSILSEIGFVPLVSTVLRTNIFSQLLQLVKDDQKTNQSIFKAVINVCSPNININHKRGVVLLKALQDLMSTKKKSLPKAEQKAESKTEQMSKPKTKLEYKSAPSFSDDVTPTPSTFSSPEVNTKSGFSGSEGTESFDDSANDNDSNGNGSTEDPASDLSEPDSESDPDNDKEDSFGDSVYGNFFPSEKLLPKAFVKFTIDEPAARLILEDCEDEAPGMVITTASKIYCDIETNHTMYKDHSNYEVDISTLSNSFETWYRSSNGERHNICLSESIHFRVRANTQPQLSLSLIGRLSNAHILLTKEEIVRSIHKVFRIIKKSKSSSNATKRLEAVSGSDGGSNGSGASEQPEQPEHPIFIRTLPKWLSHCKLEVADTAISIATKDARYNDGIYRGLTFKVARSIIDYRSDVSKIRNHQITNGGSTNPSTHRTNPDYVPRKVDTDGRRLAMLFDGIEVFKVQEPHGLKFEGSDKCLSIPGFSLSCTTMTTPGIGPTLQCNSLMKITEGQFDMNTLFLLLLVVDRIKYTLAVPNAVSNAVPTATTNEVPAVEEINNDNNKNKVASRLSDFVAVQFKTEMIRFKISLPNAMKLMLELDSLNLSHRYGSKPLAKARYIRLYASHPTVAKAWAIITSLRGMSTEINTNSKHNSKHESLATVNFDAMRINTPSEFVFYHLFDNIASMFKASLTLLEQHKVQEFDLVIRPKISKLPKIPRIRVKSNAFYLTLENDHFESDLSLIFQAGLIEQKERLERERIFESKVKDLLTEANEYSRKRSGGNHSPTSSIHGTPSISSLLSTAKRTSEEFSRPSSTIGNGTASGVLPRTGTNVTFDDSRSTTSSIKPPKRRGTNLKDAVHHALHPHSHGSKEHSEPNYSEDYLSNGPWCSRDDINKRIEDAQKAMLKHHSTAWALTIKRARANRAQSLKNYMVKNWGRDEISADTLAKEKIVDYSEDPPLLLSAINGLDLTVSGPDMTPDEIRQFIHNIGKGMPLDTKYTLFIPLYLDLKVQEWRFQLCDYPLPFIHFPRLSDSQINENGVPNSRKDLTSLHIKGNFFLAEKYYPDESSIRYVKVPIAPSADMHPESDQAKSYMIKVCRTVNSVKMFTNLSGNIYSANPTRVTYANSMQPTLQTAMMAFDSFSKPPLDPSPKLGFWDKIRSVFHARWAFHWHEGDVLLFLKGSRNPYELLGEASGFVMGWRNKVSLTINEDSNPRRFFVAKSKDYVLAIPNFAAIEKEYLNSYKNQTYKAMCPCNFEEMLSFNKVVMKFSGSVEWALGILMERNKPNAELGRTTEFRPHYDVQLKNPLAIEDMTDYDAYKGFRSEFLHMGISVRSPQSSSSRSYNTVHISPMVYHYFMHWLSLFDGSLSLPLRSGPLFQPDMLSKPKFGRSLYSVQYLLELSPVFISHTYRAKNSDSGSRYKESASGLKGKIGTFTLDLHQRREPGPLLPEGQRSQKKRWRMKLHKGELTINKMDLRVLVAEFKERSAEAQLAKKTGGSGSPGSSIITEEGSTSSYSTYVNGANWPHSNTRRIEITDNDLAWIDIDDYTEIGEVPPRNGTPRIRVLPLFFAPQWTYFRQTDHSGKDIGIDDMGKEYKKFGHLMAHDCHIGRANPEGVQLQLLKSRIHEIEDQLKTDDATLDSLQQDLLMFPNESQVKKRAQKIAEQVEILKHRRRVLLIVLKQNGLLSADEEHKLIHKEEHLDNEKLDSEDTSEGLRAAISDCESMTSQSTQGSFQELNELADLSTSTSSFNNRFILHHAQLKWNNTVRNALLEFTHRVSSRKHSRYFLSQKAIKYLEELITKRANHDFTPGTLSRASTDLSRVSDESKESSGSNSGSSTSADPVEQISGHTTQELVDDCVDIEVGDQEDVDIEEFLHHLLNSNHEASDTFLVKLVAPQIQLVSEQNPDQCLLVTTHDIELQIVDISDKRMISDDVGGAVETRYGVQLNDAQFFVLNKSNVEQNSVVYFSNGHYGNEKLSSWPPWLSVELCYDSSPLKHALVVDKTNVSFKVSRPSPVYMKKLNEAPGDGGDRTQNHRNTTTSTGTPDGGNVDEYFYGSSSDGDTLRPTQLIANFPRVSATCDSSQYFAIYTIALDLLIYNEPISQKTNERVESVLLATDFNDTANLMKRLTHLQNDIRRIARMIQDFDICHTVGLPNEEATKDRLLLEVEYNYLVAELEVMSNATRVGLLKSQRDESKSMLWCIEAKQIIWHVLTADRKPFLDIGLADASFHRLQHGDDYNANKINIGMMQGFNLTPNAIYQEVLAPYIKHDKEVLEKDVSFVSIKWVMLGPIGGIPVMQLFETDLQPLKLQVERDTGEKIFDYLFPSIEKDKTAQHDVDDDDDDEVDEDDDAETDSDTQEERIQSNRNASTTKHHHHLIRRSETHSARSGKVSERVESPFVIPRLKRFNTLESKRSLTDSDDSRSISLHSTTSGGAGAGGSTYDGHKTYRAELLASDSVSLRSRSTRLSSSSYATGLSSDRDRQTSGLNSSKKIDHHNHNSKSKKSKKDEKETNNEVSTMMKRAANYMSIVKILIHSTELCVSYKGHGSRSLADIHELVIKLPEFIYENKTWTNLDLALHLKKDVVKTLFHHTGALIGNKLTKRKKLRKTLKSTGPLRQINDYVQFTPITELVENSRRSSLKPPALSITNSSEVDETATTTAATNDGGLGLPSLKKQTTESSGESNGVKLKNTVTDTTITGSSPSVIHHANGKSGASSSQATLAEPKNAPALESLSKTPSKTPTNGSASSKYTVSNSNSNSTTSSPSTTSSSHFSLLRRSKSRLSTYEEEPGDTSSTHSTPKKSRNIFKKLKNL